jgi:uncharacterized membrane protein YfcA
MLPMENVRVLVHIAVVLALVLLMIKPQRWLRDADPERSRRNPGLTLLVLTAGIGLWTGLIMLDSGTYLLMSLVLVGGLALQQASAVKAVLVGSATVVTLGVFIRSGQVDWGAALPLMLGSALGGWLGALLTLGHHARIWIYRLIAALVFELGGMPLGGIPVILTWTLAIGPGSTSQAFLPPEPLHPLVGSRSSLPANQTRTATASNPLPWQGVGRSYTPT